MAELWDIYDSDGNRTGRTVRRGTPLRPGEFHLGAIIVVVNSSREVLCTLRSPEKRVYPNMWENSGGAALAGDDSLTTAVRELKEETGISAEPGELTFLYRASGIEPVTEIGFFNDIYGMRRDLPAGDVVLQEGETVDARWIPYGEWERLGRAGKILTPAGPDNDEFFRILRNYIGNE